MARHINRLSDRKVQSLKEPGRHADGNGLYLVVDKAGAKRWVFMSFTGKRLVDGKEKKGQVEIGLGGLASVSLAMARQRAEDCRRHIADGRDPREAFREAKPIPSFGEVAEQVISEHEKGWRNDKHKAQWRSTLDTYAATLRDKPVDTIETEHVLACLKPIWTKKAETASRVRGRIEKVLDAAKAKGLRSGENPARWKGHLNTLLGKRQKLQHGHHPSMPWQEVPAFVARLRAAPSVSTLALEFVILTACRSGEVLRSVRGGELMGARWDEIDREAKVWTVPAKRMKGGVEHRVPLVPRALEILEELEKIRTGPWIFPGQRQARGRKRRLPDDAHGVPALSEMALEMILRKWKVKPFTVHGFRASFSTWRRDATRFERELGEVALAHAIESDVEAAYQRGDALERRRVMMQAWADHCGAVTVENVIPLPARKVRNE